MTNLFNREWTILELLASLTYQVDRIDTYLYQITKAVCDLVGVDWAIVTVREEDQGQIIASSQEPNGPSLAEGAAFTLHGTLADVIGRTERLLVIEDARESLEYGHPPDGYLCYLGVPLKTSDSRTIGTICCFHSQPRSFSAVEVRTVELLAERAAIALENYRLYQQQLALNQFLEAEVAKRTAELRVAQETLMAQEMVAAIGQFAAMVVHEVRNPLTTVMMGLKHLSQLDAPEAARATLDQAQQQSRHLDQLLREVLKYAKPQTLKPIPMELNAWCTECLETLRASLPILHTRQIDWLPASEPVYGCIDPPQLKEVMAHLLRNACEAIAPDDVVTWAVEVDRPAWIRLTIHNGGPPIPPEQLSQFSRPFFTTKPQGTGLGLAIAQRIVEAHGGDFGVRSTSESGTTVTVRLPLIGDLDLPQPTVPMSSIG